MLNEIQKTIIEATIKNIFFDLMDEVPHSVQVIACQAALAFSTFIEHLPLLKKYNIKEMVQTVGEILNHPAPQNPMETTLHLNATSTVFSPPYIPFMVNGEIKPIRKGYFNLLSRNEFDQLPPTEEEVKIFVQSLLKKKIEDLSSILDNESLQQPQEEQASEQENPASKKPRLAFSQETVEQQLKELQITVDNFIECTTNEKLPYYQEFLKQFGIKNLDMQEAVNIALKEWHAEVVKEYRETLNYVSMSREEITFNHVVAAKLNNFSEFFKFSRANFNSFKALKRLALLNGHLDVYNQQEVVFDNYETSYLLIKLSNYPLFSNYFDEKTAQELPYYCANSLVSLCLEQPTVNLSILDHLLRLSQAHSKHLGFAFSELMTKQPQNFTIVLISKVFLRCIKFTQMLPKKTAKAAFKLAVEFDDFEMQALVLNQSPLNFSARLFFNKETFFTLARQGAYAAVCKVANLQAGRLLSFEDLKRIEEITQGKYKLREDSTLELEHKLVWIAGESTNPSLLTNFQRLQAAFATATNGPPVAAERPTDENRPTLT